MFGKVEEPPASGSLSQKQIDSAVGGGGGGEKNASTSVERKA